MRIKNKWTCVPFIAVLITILIFSFSFDSSTACYAKTKKKAVKIVTYSSYSEAVVKLRQAAINTQTVNFRLKMSKKTSVSRLAEDKPVEQVKDEMYESASEFGYLYEFHDTDENLNDNEDNE